VASLYRSGAVCYAVPMAHPVRRPSPQRSPQNAAVIAGRDNRWLKRFRAALSGEGSEDGAVGVEGVRLVEAALGSGLPVEALLVSESGARHLPRVAHVLPEDVPVLRTTDKLFAGVADTKTPQGVAALVRPRQASIEDLLRGGTALLVALVGVQDPGNVGTTVRAAEAFGASGVATCIAGDIGTADPFSPKALRASAGSALRLPIARSISTTVLLAQLRILRVKVCAAVASAEAENSERSTGSQVQAAPVPPWYVDWKGPTALLIGNEGAGLPAEVVRSADACVYIPQATSTFSVGLESLNAAMAASVLLYEAARQRAGSPGTKL
jgi:RNA methyltransferase, TrmH family